MKIAIVDDNQEDLQRIKDCLLHYEQDKNVSFSISEYSSSIDFLEEYRGDVDVIFLDIEMPGADGISVAHEIRAKDSAVGIIFVTSLAQYAIAGYEVQAMDYIVKPLRYFTFCVKLERALRLYQSRKCRPILVKTSDGLLRLNTEDIFYIDKDRNDLLYHTARQTYSERGSLKDLKATLSALSFEECMSGCLVNFRHVEEIGKDSVLLTSGESLPFSRRNKKSFTEKYIEYMNSL